MRRDSSRYFYLALPDKTGLDLITPLQAVLSCYLPLVYPPTPRAISPALSRQLTCIYTCCMQLQTRPAVHLKLAPPLPGGCLLSCGLPFCSPSTFVNLLSSNIYQSYHCTYFCEVSCASPAPHINSCTSRAPLHVHPVHPSHAPRAPIVHLYCPCTHCVHLMHLSCTSTARAPIACTSTSAPIYYCTTARAPITSNYSSGTSCSHILLHYYCTTTALLLHHYCCATAWSRAATTAPLHNLMQHSTLVAPLASSPWNPPTQVYAHPLCVPTVHTLVGILNLALCPLVAPFKKDLDHTGSHLFTASAHLSQLLLTHLCLQPTYLSHC